MNGNKSDLRQAGRHLSALTVLTGCLFAGASLASGPLRILCVGDSITVGYTDNPTWRVPFEFGYRSGLYTRLSQAGYAFQFVGESPEPWNNRHGTVTNAPAVDLRKVGQDHHRGYGGWGTKGILDNLPLWLATDKPDVVLLMIGINDNGSGEAQKSLQRIVQTIVTNQPEADVIVAQITPKANYSKNIETYNTYIRETLVPAFQAEGRHVSTVNQYTHLLTQGQIDKTLFSNGINHPGAVAYDRMAQTWYDGILAVRPLGKRHESAGRVDVGRVGTGNEIRRLPMSCDTTNCVRSSILNREIGLAPTFGRPEKSFIGSGRVGGGGTVEGVWDYLIGPNYSSPNFITSEALQVSAPSVDNKGKPLAFSMRRLRGSGALFGSAQQGALAVELIEWAPWDGHEVIRLVQVRNTGPVPVAGVFVSTEIVVSGHPLLESDRLSILQPKGGPSFGTGSECINWLNRRADLAWSLPGGVKHLGDGRYRLYVTPTDLPPGGVLTAALVHQVQETTAAFVGPQGRDWVRQLEADLAAWKAWFDAGNDGVRHPVYGVLVESQLAFMRMQQSYDGGLIAGVRRYANSYVRDMHGAVRGFQAAGQLESVRRELEWIDRKFRAFKVIVNASEMGIDRRDFGVHGNNKGTELEAYYLLMARGFLRQGGKPEALAPFKESLMAAALVQVEESRKRGWRFLYNGDETERYVPCKDGDTYGFSKPDWHHRRTGWSMPSHVLAMASTAFVADVLAPLWGFDPAPYREAIEQWRASFTATFLPDGRRIPVWTVFSDGSLPAYSVTPYLCFPAWVDAPFPVEQKREWALEAFKYLKEPGILPVSPGEVEGTTGNALAMLLYALKATDAAPEAITKVEQAILQGGQLQWFGLANEFYGPGNVPNPHNLRPFETGPVLEALLFRAGGQIPSAGPGF